MIMAQREYLDNVDNSIVIYIYIYIYIEIVSSIKYLGGRCLEQHCSALGWHQRVWG